MHKTPFALCLRLPCPRRYAPPVEIVFVHTLICEGRKAVEVPLDTREIQHIEPDLLVIARVIELVQGMPGAEFRADRVPDEFEEFDALLSRAVRTTVILFYERAQIVIEQVLITRWCDERAAAEIDFKQVMDRRPTLV